jgi:SAM-dependent methyltransferase
LPILDLVERGYEVEGLDASQDMLDRCRAAAQARGLQITLHRGEMQAFALPRRYRSIFLAGASFTLLTSDADAQRALSCIHDQLEAGGSALIPLEVPDVDLVRRMLGRVREVTNAAGERLRVSMIAFEELADGRTHSHRLRYERILPNGESELVERDWRKRWWSPAQFREMLEAAGFERVSMRTPGGGRVAGNAPVFVALAQKAGG